MSRRLRHWILLVNHHSSETWILPEGDRKTFEIAPNGDIKRGDIVYLWWNPHSCFYGWGEVVETPKLITVEVPGRNNEMEKKRRTSVLVRREKEFYPRRITAEMMSRDKNLKKFIPKGFDDLCAIPLETVRAHYLNDYVTEHKLEAPKGSTTVRWSVLDNAPDITVQAILTFGDKTNEGRLVEGVRIAWDEIVRIITNDPNEILKIDPRRFEELIAGAYVKDGYEVELTPRSGDKGRDVVATKPGFGSIRIFDQVKRYKFSRPVTAEEVRALVGVITMAGNVSKGVITTTSTFAPTLLDDPDIKRLVPHRLELRPKDDLLRWLGGLRRY
jgi:restriction system protein